MFKSIPKKILYGIAGGIVAIAVIAIILVNVNSTINLDKYVEVTYEGYEGYGRATVSIDWASIQNKYGSKLKYTNAGASMYGNYEAPVDALSDFISTPTLDNSTGLKNDDEITYTWDIDEDELSKYIKCKVKYKDKTLTVSGLEEVETFDAFESLDVTFNGAGPAGYVTYEYNGEIFDTYDFYADKESGLSNGDVVTISIGIDDLEYFADNYGKIPAETSKEYTVEGLDADNLTAETEDYLCSYSAEREITREEIDTYMSTDYSSYNFPGDRTIVQMIINEMYARHGYEFTDDELTQYFNNKEWYSSIDDKTNDMDKIYKGMSSVEQANVTLLQEYQ